MDLNGSLTPQQVWRPELDADKKSRTLQKEQAKSNAGIHDEHLDKPSVARHSLADHLCRPQQSGTNHHEHLEKSATTPAVSANDDTMGKKSFRSARIIYGNIFHAVHLFGDWGSSMPGELSRSLKCDELEFPGPKFLGGRPTAVPAPTGRRASNWMGQPVHWHQTATRPWMLWASTQKEQGGCNLQLINMFGDFRGTVPLKMYLCLRLLVLSEKVWMACGGVDKGGLLVRQGTVW